MTLISFTDGENTYQFTADTALEINLNEQNGLMISNSMTGNEDISGDIHVYKNGTEITNNIPKERFSWAGVPYTASDFLTQAITVYVNGTDYGCEFFDAANDIQKIKAAVEAQKTEDGLNKQYLTLNGDLLTLEFATKERAGYASEYAEHCAYVRRADMAVLTDIDEMYCEAMSQHIIMEAAGDKDYAFTYMSDSFAESAESERKECRSEIAAERKKLLQKADSGKEI